MTTPFIPELSSISCQSGMVCYTLLGKNASMMTFEEGLNYIRYNQMVWHKEILLPVINQINPAGVFIEFPKLTRQTLKDTFEMVIISSDNLANCATTPTPEIFADAINHCMSTDVLTTPNLSGDAILLMPHPHKYYTTNFANISTFMNNCTEANTVLINVFWASFKEIIYKEIETKGHVWVSTHGLGVNWLHVRFAREPKYYCYSEYLRHQKKGIRT